MRTSIFKPIIAGILIGAALFFFGFFILRIFIVFLIIAAIFRFFIRRSFRRRFGNGYPYGGRRFNSVHPGDIREYRHAAVIHLHRKEDDNIIHLD